MKKSPNAQLCALRGEDVRADALSRTGGRKISPSVSPYLAFLHDVEQAHDVEVALGGARAQLGGVLDLALHRLERHGDGAVRRDVHDLRAGGARRSAGSVDASRERTRDAGEGGARGERGGREP
jgi:hypothetical protein